jgi:Protein of unknown function (DUF3800)
MYIISFHLNARKEHFEKTMKIFNVYCDESCHLENDRQKVMVLGAISCPADCSRSIAKQIKAIKVRHGLNSDFEIKWTKVSPGKIDFYINLLSFFFEEPELCFRALIIPDKNKLKHEQFNHDHNTWYYKMYFELLKPLLNPTDEYCIYLDIKDSGSTEKVRQLKEVLSNNQYDFQRKIIQKLQNIRSHEVEQVQLADLLTGCVLAANRDREASLAKTTLMEQMRSLSKYRLTQTTLLRERKVNLLCWIANEPSYT